MREMKDSGVEWIGEIPQNWKQSKVKYLMSLTNGRAYKQQELLAKGTYRVLRVGNFNTNDKWYYSDLELPEKQYCEKGDLLYLWATTFGPAFWNEEKVIYHYHIWKVDRFRNYIQRYAFYALDANAEWQRMQSHGSTMVHVTKEGVENTVLPAPPLPEQRRIVAFLDEWCAAIDADIAKRREAIEKLKEYKKALIAHAVTKGLDPDVKLKESGVEWIGEVPADWEIVPVKADVAIGHGSDPVLSGDIPVWGSGNEPFKTCGEYKEGPVVLLGRKGTLDCPQLVVGRYWNVDTAFDAKIKSSNLKLKFFYYAATCIDIKPYATNTAKPSMTQFDWANSKIPRPPLSEQHRIIAFLDKRCMSIDEAMTRQEQLIAKLEGYRKSLIYHAVTGKIDFREEANAR